MSFKEFLEDLRFEGEQPAKKGTVLISVGFTLFALFATGLFGYGMLMHKRAISKLEREQLKNQYTLRALCNLPENKSACEKGLSDTEYDKD